MSASLLRGTVRFQEMKRVISVTITACTLGYAGVVCFYSAVSASLNHDEHQFMTGAYMVARQGLQPFRDFAYFHMPNLVYIYSLFFFTPNPLLAARLFNALCAFGICLTIFLVARLLFRSFGLVGSAIIAAASTILLCNNDFFQNACRVWNHDSATLCAIGGFCLMNKALRERRLTWFALAGFAIGMAIGIRLTFASLLVPFLFATLAFGSASWRAKARSALVFALGALVANLPAIYFCLSSYRDFMFGTFEYSRLNTRYFAETFPMVVQVGKVRLLADAFQYRSSNLFIPLVAFFSLLLLAVALITRSTRPKSDVVFLIVVLGFLLVGCFAPTPFQYQYAFALCPFLLLLTLYALASLPSRELLLTGLALIVLTAGISFFSLASSPANPLSLGGIFHPSTWTPVQVAEQSRWIKNHIVSTKPVKVLTLSSIAAVEAGLPIYPEFVTGPFAWRVSHLLPADQAAARKLPWAPGFADWLNRERPLAVLTGNEQDPIQEGPIIQEITRLGYSQLQGPRGLVLWQPTQ